MCTYAIMEHRQGGGLYFVATRQNGEVVAISARLTEDACYAITMDLASWPAWGSDDDRDWARPQSWHTISVVGSGFCA